VNELSAVLTVASRDMVKLLRDRTRLAFSVVFPFVWIGLLGATLQGNLGRAAGFNFVSFIFTGVLAMGPFQSAAQGLVSLIQDRESDFSQVMFVAPISRYSIVVGKVLGETFAAFLQVPPMIVIALALGVPLTLAQILLLLPASLFAGLLGGAFGLVIMSLFNDQRTAQQIFPFLIIPQLFLAGILNPIKILPWYLAVFSLASPMRYMVDLERNIAFAGQPGYSQVVLLGPIINLAVMAAMFTVFVAVGTWLFVRHETRR
jgi:ABC-2 type transport system permease protein